jgi:hypothetical protein
LVTTQKCLTSEPSANKRALRLGNPDGEVVKPTHHPVGLVEDAVGQVVELRPVAHRIAVLALEGPGRLVEPGHAPRHSPG